MSAFLFILLSSFGLAGGGRDAVDFGSGFCDSSPPWQRGTPVLCRRGKAPNGMLAQSLDAHLTSATPQRVIVTDGLDNQVCCKLSHRTKLLGLAVGLIV
jgi:hypothetical protein